MVAQPRRSTHSRKTCGKGWDETGQKELPSKYLYDDIGSALFEVITKLPEYGLTRAEERILLRHSGAIAERLPPHGMVVELGSGSGRKTRRILEALAHHQVDDILSH